MARFSTIEAVTIEDWWKRPCFSFSVFSFARTFGWFGAVDGDVSFFSAVVAFGVGASFS